jgi:hypothetical protein
MPNRPDAIFAVQILGQAVVEGWPAARLEAGLAAWAARRRS